MYFNESSSNEEKEEKSEKEPKMVTTSGQNCLESKLVGSIMTNNLHDQNETDFGF